MLKHTSGISLYQDEEWRPVPEFEGLYEVSNQGRVRRAAPGPGTWPGKVNATRLTSRGYVIVTLSRASKNYTRYVHRLVAQAFLGQPLPQQEVNHKNANKADNRVQNLEWVTHEKNVKHAVRLGIVIQGEKHYASRFTDEAIREIRQMASDSIPYKKIAELFNTTTDHVSSIAVGRKRRGAGGPLKPGGILRGSKSPRSKISESDVLTIRNEAALGVPYSVLAKRFGVAQPVISYIARGKSWKHVGGPIQAKRKA